MHGRPSCTILRQFALLLVMGGLLTACSNPLTSAAATLQQILDVGWPAGEAAAEADEAKALSAASPVYCYGTIGEGDCYGAPLSVSGNRLVGYQGPPPEGAMQK